ncbi:hypothetical protein G9A89_011946 [Geosiphon pyriformis]|nr:hypothetical protein G9A89_011946 [Geosiphon pyriformis]
MTLFKIKFRIVKSEFLKLSRRTMSGKNSNFQRTRTSIKPNIQKCAFCSSTKWASDGAGGYVCEFGHRNESAEEFAELQDESRKKRSKKKSDVEPENRPPTKKELKKSKVYHGGKGLYIYVVALQYILRRQVKVMVDDIKCPQELEQVVRHLWILYINKANHLPFPEIWLDDSGKIRPETEVIGETDNVDGEDEEENLERLLLIPEDETFEFEHQDEHTENDEFGETTAAGVDSSTKINPKTKLSRNSNMILQGLRLNLVLLYLGCVYLRQPILFIDIYRWANKNRIPYFTSRSLLPDDIKLRIGQYLEYFSPMFLGSLWNFRIITKRILTMYQEKYKITFPELNGPLILYRFVRDLFLPVEFYVIAKELGNLINLKIRIPAIGDADPLPESKLMALVIIVAKMVYGLDGRPRIPIERDQFSWYFPTLDKWFAALQEGEANNFKREFPINIYEWHEYSETHPDEYIKIAAKHLRDDERYIPTDEWVVNPSGLKRSKELSSFFRKMQLDEKRPNESPQNHNQSSSSFENLDRENSKTYNQSNDDEFSTIQEQIRKHLFDMDPNYLTNKYRSIWEHKDQSETNNERPTNQQPYNTEDDLMSENDQGNYQHKGKYPDTAKVENQSGRATANSRPLTIGQEYNSYDYSYVKRNTKTDWAESYEEVMGEYQEDYKRLLMYAAEKLGIHIVEMGNAVVKVEKLMYIRGKKTGILPLKVG